MTFFIPDAPLPPDPMPLHVRTIHGNIKSRKAHQTHFPLGTSAPGMADSDAGPEPTETTGLLAYVAETRPDPALGDANGAVVHSSGSALQNGVVEPPSSAPLLEGNVEFKRKLYLVFPAVSLGVSNWLSIAIPAVLIEDRGIRE